MSWLSGLFGKKEEPAQAVQPAGTYTQQVPPSPAANTAARAAANRAAAAREELRSLNGAIAPRTSSPIGPPGSPVFAVGGSRKRKSKKSKSKKSKSKKSKKL